MKWLGDKLRERVAAAKCTQAQFAEQIGVSRQTFIDWCNGQVPKGMHLLKIGKLLEVGVDVLFSVDVERQARATVPMHRKKGAAKVTPEVQLQSHRLALDYLDVITSQTHPPLTLQSRCIKPDLSEVPRLATALRDLAELDDPARPIGYQHVFTLTQKLGICIIFKLFPVEIQSHYAFYTVINGQRVVFVNTAINLLDLIFPIIHEAVHAVRDLPPAEGYDQEEEDFCDAVANAVQFPVSYVNMVWSMIKDLRPAQQITTLKAFAEKNHHACYGLVRCIRARHPNELTKLNVCGADANLRKKHKSFDGLLLPSDGTPEQYLTKLKKLSPLFFQALVTFSGNCTAGRLGELLDLGTLDAKQVRSALEAEKAGE